MFEKIMCSQKTLRQRIEKSLSPHNFSTDIFSSAFRFARYITTITAMPTANATKLNVSSESGG